MFVKIEDRWINSATVQSVMPNGATGGATIAFTNGVICNTHKHSADAVVHMMLNAHLEPHERGKRR